MLQYREMKTSLQTPRQYIYECEILEGLAPSAINEIQRRFKSKARLLPARKDNLLHLNYSGSIKDLLSLRSVVAVHTLQHFNIPRPKALLGHQHLTSILAVTANILEVHPNKSFRTFTFNAAGRDSSVFNRLKEEIQAHTKLAYQDEEADLQLRFRPSLLNPSGWDVLTRISPRPLSARSWRVFDIEGALNANVAAAMIDLTQPAPQDRFLNLMAGSGTLLIERLLRGGVKTAVGCENDLSIMAGANRNIAAANLTRRPVIVPCDAARLPFAAKSFDVICADLPWGQLVGSIQENQTLYPSTLAEAARVAGQGARLAIVSHNIRLMEKMIQEFSRTWELTKEIKIQQGGLHPRIYIFKHRG